MIYNLHETMISRLSPFGRKKAGHRHSFLSPKDKPIPFSKELTVWQREILTCVLCCKTVEGETDALTCVYVVKPVEGQTEALTYVYVGKEVERQTENGHQHIRHSHVHQQQVGGRSATLLLRYDDNDARVAQQ